MKKMWLKWAERIDNVALRERVMIFASVALVMVMLIENLLVDPVLARQRRLANEVMQEQSQIRQFQDQIQKSARARGEDPDAVNRERLEVLRTQLAEGEKLIQERQTHIVAADRMAGLLEDLLKRNQKLELVDLKTIPMTELSEPQATKLAEGRPAGNGGAASLIPPLGERKVYRHGVQITIKGPYLDLLGYVTQLEKLDQRMFWNQLEFVAGQYPENTMAIRVYTLSLDKAWLVV